MVTRSVPTDLNRDFLFTSESVSEGHPDKLADQISDAILDACLKEDPLSRVACETLLSKELVVIAGEITSRANPDYKEIARQVLRDVGYTSSELGIDADRCKIKLSLSRQVQDIASGVVDSPEDNTLGAGDQGLMFGNACDEIRIQFQVCVAFFEIFGRLRYAVYRDT